MSTETDDVAIEWKGRNRKEKNVLAFGTAGAASTQLMEGSYDPPPGLAPSRAPYN